MAEYQSVAAHGLIQRENKYLVLRRSPQNDYKPGIWDIPGGGVEFGEDPVAGVEREVYEESGLNVKATKPVYVYSSLSSPERHQFQIIYECKDVSGEVVLDPMEHDDHLWATVEEIEQLDKIPFLQSLYENLLKK